MVVSIDEGDNAPLPVAEPHLLLPSYRLRFFQPPGERLRLLYGNPKLAAPKYDLALIAPRLAGAAEHEAVPAGESPGEEDSPIARVGLFWAILVLAVVVLLFLLMRLLRSPEPAG